MINSKARGQRWFAAGLLSIAALVATGTISAGEETTAVDVVFEQRAAAFSAYDPHLMEEVRLLLHQEALRLLGETFPFLEWRAADKTMAPRVDPVPPRVVITMESEIVSGVRVYLTCAAHLPGQKDFTTSITAEVFPSDAIFPEPNPGDPDADKQQLIDPGREALRNLIPVKQQQWQTEVVRKISLAKDVIPGNRRLILPVTATRLQAGEESTLLIKFQGQVPDEGPVEGTIKISPSAEVLGDGTLRGMQSCIVKRFSYEPDTADDWHDRIPVVIGHRLPNTLSVCMETYVASSRRLSLEP